MIDSSFWRERRVFVTGHTGFKGAWLSLMLERLSARVTGYGLDPATHPSLYELAHVSGGLCDVRGDVCDAALLDGALRAADPDVVIHLATRPPRSAEGASASALERLRATGGPDLLDCALRAPSVHTILFVSPEPAYVSLDWMDLTQKADAHVVSLHCPDPVGGGDFAAESGAKPTHFGAARALHVLDALYGVLLLAEKAGGEVDGLARAWSFSRDSHASRMEAAGWSALLDSGEANEWTREWRDALAHGADMRDVTLEQIDRYLGQRVRLTSPFGDHAAHETAPLRRAVGA